MNHENLVKALFIGMLHRMPDADELKDWVKGLTSGVSAERLALMLLESQEFKKHKNEQDLLWVPPGHYYSPVVELDEARAALKAPANPPSLDGIEISLEHHQSVWNELLPYVRKFPFSEKKTPPYRYYADNHFFAIGDASIYFAMLLRHKPKRIVEVGSGFSSALALDTNEHFLNNTMELTFIEPHPKVLRTLLSEKELSTVTIHEMGVQKAPLEEFQSLDSGDFLFVDSTHVLKTGSDVTHELFNILPKLKAGVIVHFHDVFWPFEYPEPWVLGDRRSWNELYALRAFLMYQDLFKIEFFGDFFVKQCRQRIATEYPAMLANSGCGLWLRKCR